MVTSYIFNFTDPWASSFNLNAFSSNGPVFPLSLNLESTAVAANTSFVLYGKGHPNYGERIQENLIHQLESFSGSVEPTYPISGQQWFLRYDVIRTGGTTWWEWDVATTTWIPFVPILSAPTPGIAPDLHGIFNFNGDPILVRTIDTPDHPLTPSVATVQWQDLTSLGDPNAASFLPQLQLMQFDGNVWVPQNTVRASDVEPPGAILGDLWLDTNPLPSLDFPSGEQLKVFDGATYVPVAENYLLLNGGFLTGILDMGGNRIENLGTPLVNTDATTKLYVDTAVAGAVSGLDDLTDVSLTGGDPILSTIRPFLKFDGVSEMNASSLLLADVSDVTASVTEVNHLVGVTGDVQTQLNNRVEASGDTMSGLLSMGSNFVSDVLNPVNPQDAATKFYVDDEITNAINAQTLLAGQDQTNYDNVFPNGTFVVGTGYAAFDTITLSDGSLITVVGIGGGGSVATFTVTTSGLTNVTLGVALTQIITSGGGTLFTLTPELANVLSFGGTDTYLVSGSLDGAGTLTLTRNDIGVSQFAVAGFAIAGHTHASGTITHTPLSSSQLSLNAVPPTTVEDTFFQLEEAMRFRTSPRRNVQTGLVGTGPFNVPGYEPGRDKLQVFLNGVKLIADEMSNDSALFNLSVDGSTDTGLVASTPYAFGITVDGVTTATVAFTTSAGVIDFVTLVSDINTALGVAAIGATCVFEDGELYFYSDTHGTTADVALAPPGAGTDVFLAITAAGTFNSFSANAPVGVDWGYRETGFYGDTNLSGTITTIAALIAADVLEAIVLGDSGVA